MLKIYKFDLIVFNRQQERDETENLLVGSVWDLNNKSWSYWCCWSILVILLVLLVHPIFSTTAFSLIAVGQLHQKMTCETENFLVGNVLNLNNKCKGFHIGVGGPRHLFHQHGFLTQCCRLVFNWQQERWHVKLRTSWLEMCEIWTRNEGDFILFIGVVGPRHLFDRHGFLTQCRRLVFNWQQERWQLFGVWDLNTKRRRFHIGVVGSNVHAIFSTGTAFSLVATG